MDLDQLRIYKKVGAVEEIVLYQGGEGWEIWAYGKGIDNNRLRTTRDGVRTWTDAGRAIRFLLAEGFTKFSVDVSEPVLRRQGARGRTRDEGR